MIKCIHCLIDKDQSCYSKSNLKNHNFVCRNCNKIICKQWREDKRQELKDRGEKIYLEKLVNNVEKFCLHCENKKPYNEFAKNHMKEDGCIDICKTCMIIYGKKIRDDIGSTKKTYTLIEKCCQLCEITKPIEQFNKTKTNRDGYSRLCKQCNQSEHVRLRKLYPGKFRHYDAIKLTKRLQRFVEWADLKIIREIYDKCPPSSEVDHIIPLQGEFISGLHVESNLQYLTKTENISKFNHIDLEAYNQQHMPAYIEKINKMIEKKWLKAQVAI